MLFNHKYYVLGQMGNTYFSKRLFAMEQPICFMKLVLFYPNKPLFSGSLNTYYILTEFYYCYRRRGKLLIQISKHKYIYL